MSLLLWHAGVFLGAKSSSTTPTCLYHHQNNLKTDFIRDAKDRGLGVMAWTVNSTEEMEMVIMTGVDAIVTDHPEKIPVAAAKVRDKCRLLRPFWKPRATPATSAMVGMVSSTIYGSSERPAVPVQRAMLRPCPQSRSDRPTACSNGYFVFFPSRRFYPL